MQDEAENTVCRLCLISCERNYADLEAVTIEILGSLGLELDLNRGKPVICSICSESLQKCFDFKAVCVCTEDYINSFRCSESNPKRDLGEIYLRKKEKENINIARKCYTVCRLCMEVAESGYVALNDETKDVVLAKTILNRCFSELDLNATENPIICTTCNECLHSYFNFIKNCLDMAGKIKNDCESEGCSSKPEVDSNYVVQIKTENKLIYESDYAGRYTQKNWNGNELNDENKLTLGHLIQNGSQELHIKHEVGESEESGDDAVVKLNSSLQFTTTNNLYCENGYIDTNIFKKCHENEQTDETELKCENFEEAESHEVKVKHEEMDIKAEAEDTTRYQDNVLTPTDASTKITYQCDVCTFRTRHYSDLKQHMLIHKATSEMAADSCGICAYKAKHKGNLKRHMLVHKSASEVTTYSCGKCTYKTKHEYYLRRHLIIHKSASEVKAYSCGICTFKTKRKSYLKHHMLVHKSASEVTMYSCEICTFKTKRKNNLKQHTLIHECASKIMKYSCGICKYKTKEICRLKKHMLIHDNAPEIATNSDVESVVYVPPIVVYIN